MTEVDTSIYKSAQTPNMLTGIGQAISAANGLQQNQLLQTANDQNKLDLTLKQVGAFRQSLGSLLNKPDLSNADIRDAATNAVAQGFATPQQVATELSGLPSDDAPMSQRQAWVTNHYMRQVSHETQLQQLVGGIGTVNDGQGTRFVQTAPSRGVSTPQGVSNIPTQLSPSDQAGLVESTQNVRQPDGTIKQQRVMIPRSALFNLDGSWKGPGAAPAAQQPTQPGVGAQAPAAPAAPAQQPSPAGQPRPAPTAAPAAATPSASAAAQGAQSPGSAAVLPSIPAAPALGEAEAISSTAQASAGQGNALQALADQAPSRKATLAGLEKDLSGFRSGPLADAMRTGAAAWNQAAGILSLPQGIQFDPNEIASKEAFLKQATQLQAQQAQALGGTDMAKSIAGSSNPNIGFSNLGNQNVIAILKGNEDAISAKNGAWQEWKKSHGPDTYGEFQSQFNKGFEPRAFQLPYMTRAERQAAIKSMSPNELKQVRSAYNEAVKNGYINPGQ